MKRFLTAITLTLALFGCGRMEEPVVDQRGPVTLEVTAERPDAIKTETRVTLSDDNLVWEETERLSVLFGASRDTSGGPGGPRAILDGVSAGRFKGTIDMASWYLKDYSMNDVKAIVTPADRNMRYEVKSGTGRLAMSIAASQVQWHNGMLNGEYVPLFAWVNGDQLRQEDGKYTLDGIQLNYGCALMRLHIYGTAPDMAADEIFKSVTIQCSSKAITGTGYWYKSSGFSSSVSASTSTPILVKLEENCTMAGRTFEDALQIFAATLPRYSAGNTPTLTKLTVTTNKGVYEKSVSTTLKLQAGHVLPVRVDLSTFTRTAGYRMARILNECFDPDYLKH